MQGQGAPPPPPAPAPTPTWIPLVAGGVFLAAGLFGCLATGLAAATMSESDAVVVSYVGVPMALGGVVAAIAALVARNQQPAVAAGAPVGCGCATVVVGIVALVVFYTAIWPSL